MLKNWVDVSETGQLLYIKSSPLTWHVKNDSEKILSIIKYEFGNITVKTMSGETKTISAEFCENSSQCADPSIIRYAQPREIYPKYGFIMYLDLPITFAQVMEYSRSFVILADGTKMYALDILNKKSTDYYCKNGKLTKIDFIWPVVKAGDFIIIKSVAGETYAIRAVYTPYRMNDCELFVNGDSALYIPLHDNHKLIGFRIHTKFSGYSNNVCFINKHVSQAQWLDSSLLNMPDVVSVVQTNNLAEITTGDGKTYQTNYSSRGHIIDHKIKRISVQQRDYYINDQGEIFDCRRFIDQYSIFEKDGKYFDDRLNPLEIVSKCKWPVGRGGLIQINRISKISGTIIINEKYAILSKFAMDLVNIELNEDSDLFPLKITTKTGESRLAALFTGNSFLLNTMYVLFENGDYWPLCLSDEDKLYSPHGPYTLVPDEEITKYNDIVYIIRGNFVLFKYVQYPIKGIFESFGNFMIINDSSIHIGKITINKPHTGTKAIIRAANN